MAVSRKRLWKRVVLGVFGILALLILVAPWIGAPILRSAAVSRLQEALGRTVELDGLDVGWTSGVTAIEMNVSQWRDDLLEEKEDSNSFADV